MCTATAFSTPTGESPQRQVSVYLSVQLDFSVLFLIIRNELQHELNNLRIG